MPRPRVTPVPVRSFRWTRRFVLGLLGVAAVAAGAAITRAYRLSVVAPATATATNGTAADDAPYHVIELHAERQGSDLKVTWDKAPTPPESTGMLAITDGATHRLLPLEPAQLRFGSVIYAA